MRTMSIVRALALILAVLAAGCLATPLPTPPSIDTQRMSLTDSAGVPGAIDLRGGPGAVRGDADLLRVTSAFVWVETVVAEDGSFEVRELRARPFDALYIEAIGADDVFLIAVRRDSGDAVTEADAGADTDGDGSPDRIDCAPDDDTFEGRTCTDLCGVETCDGFDDDCDGVIDNGCTDADGDGFSEGADCDDTNAAINPGAPEVCDDGLDNDCDGIADEECGVTCVTDADCTAGQMCVAGVCT
jgi:hypothetical protein